MHVYFGIRMLKSRGLAGQVGLDETNLELGSVA
jgi:hypothetical protein